jgi:iron-sulfur cluster assembly accessory protein
MQTLRMESTVSTPDVSALADAERVRATDKAIRHILKQMTTDPTATGFRLAVKRTGCSGWMYIVDLAHEQRPDDYVFDVGQGLRVHVDEKSFAFVRGTEIDFVSEGLTRQLVFHNPNVTAECGCGESFSIN